MAEKAILYIMGAGRSGTTLVDILLGNDSKLFSAGELNRLPKRNGIAPGRSQEDWANKFWSGISRQLSEQFSWTTILALSEKVEYHKGFFSKGKELPNEYRVYLKELFRMLFEAIEEEVIIDSSKYPMRAYHLSREFPEEFRYCIYVKKHPVAVLRSFQRKGVEQPPKVWYVVNVYLMAVHWLSSYVIKKLKKNGVKTFVANFENVVHAPLEFVSAVEREFELDLSDLKWKLATNQVLKTNMLFDGNRIRLKKDLSIKSNKAPMNWTLTEHFVYYCNMFWWKN